MMGRWAKPIFFLVILAIPAVSWADFTRIGAAFGANDAALVRASDGKTVFSKNAGKKLIPASTLKLLTALVALTHLGPEHRFETGFYTDKDGNLKIRGSGDPLLISEVLEEISKALSGKISRYKDLVIDDSRFSPITVPGVSPTFQPYDAPIGAFCVNFNTVNFRLKNGAYVSAESQTPLLPLALDGIRKSGLRSGRIGLSKKDDLPLRYSGAMFGHFFANRGIRSDGRVGRGTVTDADELLFRYVSRYSVADAVEKLLKFSNNFIANQLFVASGAKVFGPPGTLGKGIRAAGDVMRNSLKTDGITVVEGSGISRDNRISPNDMDRVLEKFAPYRNLMPRKNADFHKSGTLSGISTRAGYIDLENGGLFRYSVMFNTPGKSAEKTVRKIIDALKRSD